MHNTYTILGGRYQPFHLGHIEMVKFLQDRDGNNIVIGVVNANPKTTYPGDGDWIRFSLKDNPLSYWERYECIKLSFIDHKKILEQLHIVPMPRPSINLENANNYLPYGNRKIVVFERRNDVVARFKVDSYKDLNEAVELIDYTHLTDLGQLSEGAIIRDLIGVGSNDWKKFVHPEVAKFLEKIKIRQRLLEIGFDEDHARKNLSKFIRDNNYDVRIPQWDEIAPGLSTIKFDQNLLECFNAPYKSSEFEILFFTSRELKDYIQRLVSRIEGRNFTLPKFTPLSAELFQCEMTKKTKDIILNLIK